MRRASLKKIKSAPNPALLFGCGIILVAAGITILVVAWQQRPAPVNTLRLTAGPAHYTVEIAATEAAQEKGLGGRLAMDDDKGMIFTYDSVGLRCFWMKDMRFSLDMLWVNQLRQITRIEPNISPATYPRTYCYQGEYVIELHSGQAAKNHLKTGQSLNF